MDQRIHLLEEFVRSRQSLRNTEVYQCFGFSTEEGLFYEHGVQLDWPLPVEHVAKIDLTNPIEEDADGATSDGE